MSKRELLELAAKSGGIAYKVGQMWMTEPGFGGLALLDVNRCWNPLTDDGDALRLAVKLRISLEMYPDHVYAVHAETSTAEYRDTGSGQTMAQVVRESIVACAAELSRTTRTDGGKA